MNKTIIENYIFILKNHLSKERLLDYFPDLKIKDEKKDIINTKEIAEKIQYFFENNNYISSTSYLIYASIYIFLMLIPFLSKEKIIFYINKLSDLSKKVDFFLRYYFNLMVQTFYKYYLINNEKKNIPNIIQINIKLYLCLLFNVLNEEKILPNEDMILIHKIIEEKNIAKDNKFQINKEKLEIKLAEKFKNNDLDFSNYNFSIYMTYNFDASRFYKSKEIIKVAMKELKECNINVNNNTNSKVKSIMINMKIKDKNFSGKLFSPRKIFKEIKKEFNIYESSFSIEKTKINVLKEILLNLIQYSIELNEFKILSGLFIDELYCLDKRNAKI